MVVLLIVVVLVVVAVDVLLVVVAVVLPGVVDWVVLGEGVVLDVVVGPLVIKVAFQI